MGNDQGNEIFRSRGVPESNSALLGFSLFYNCYSFYEFLHLFEKNLIFQDYELIAKKFKIIIIRNVPKMTEDYKNLVARFIFFIDVIYENKNILSISTDVELEKIYLGRTNSFEFKRTVSRLKEMGSNAYVKDNLNFLQKN